MVKKVESGAPPPSPPIDTTTGPESVQGEAGTQPQAETNPEQPNTATAMPYDTGGQISEYNLDGQMRAALLKSLIPGSGGPTPGTLPPPGTLYWGPPGGTAGTETAPPAFTELKEGSKGTAVEEAENHINWWRAENGRKPIKVDGNFDAETKAAVSDFQKANGMKVTGKIDQKTSDRLDLENNPSFKKLDDTTKKQVRDVMNNDSTDQATRHNLQVLATDGDFAKLSPELQQAALKKLAAKPQDGANLMTILDNVKDRATLETDPKFQALHPVTQKTIREAMEKNSERIGGGARANLITLARDDNFAKLGRAQQDLVLKGLGANNNAATLGHLQKLIASDSFQNKMDDGTKARVLGLMVKHAGSLPTVESLTKLASDPKFGALSPQNKVKTLNVFENTTPAGRDALQTLLQREINGVPVLTSHGVNKNAATVLDQLERISTTPLDARLVDRSTPPKRIKNSEISEQLLQELSDPSHYIGQSRAQTCTCTSMSHRLAIRNPAEYAKIATDLATTGQSKLANGDTIRVPAGNAWQPDTTTRSHTERMVQSALMDYARPGKGYVNHNNGPDGRFGTPDDGFIPDPKQPNQRSMDGWPDRPDSGLTSDEERRVLKGLYDKNYSFYTGSFNFKSDKKDIITKIRGEIGAGSGPVNADLKWGTGGHAVEIYKIEGGRVYFRNPWGGGNVGNTGSTNGTAANNTAAGPTRKVENGANAEESMTIEDFEKVVWGAYVRD